VAAQANPNGFVTSANWLVVGPFWEPYGCSGHDENLFLRYLAPSSIHNLAPTEGDVIEYDASTAASAYWGPEKDGKPVWRLLDDGSDDDDLDLDLDAVSQGISGQDVLAYVATYVEYLGPSPVDAFFCVGSDDDVQVWLDTRLVHNNNTCRGRAQCQDIFPVTIASGTHRIAMAIWENGGGWGGSLAIQVDGSPVTDADPSWRFLGTDRNGFSLPQEGVFHREIESPSTDVNACPRGNGGPVRVTLKADLPPGVAAVAELTDVVNGPVGPAQVAAPAGAVVTARPAFTPRPLGDFTDARFIGRNPLCGEDVNTDHDDAGTPGPADDSYTLDNVGEDIWMWGDSFTFAYNRIEGDFVFTAHVKQRSFVPGSRWGKLGLMVRQDLTTRSCYAMVQDTGEDAQDGLRFAGRQTQGSSDNFEKVVLPAGTHQDWMRIVRAGNTFTGYSSPDGLFDGDEGVNYYNVGSMTIPGAPQSMLVGLAVCSHTVSCLDPPMSVVFDQVTLEGGQKVPVSPEPAGVEIQWTNISRETLAAGLAYEIDLDEGAVTFDGSTGSSAVIGDCRVDLLPPLEDHGPIADPAFPHVHSIGWGECPGNGAANPSPGEIVMTGGGFNLWSLGDAFLFAHTEAAGDFSAQVTITDRQWVPGSRWGRAGIMARQDCSRRARYSLIDDTGEDPADGNRFESRMTQGGSDNNEYDDHPFIGQHSSTLRLDRCGSTFTGYVLSEDDPASPGEGTFGGPVGEWVEIGSHEWADAPDSVFLGLVVESNVFCELTTIAFKDWTVIPGCPGKVEGLSCTETPGGLSLTWTNPAQADTSKPISIRADGEEIAVLPGSAESTVIAAADLQHDPVATIAVVNSNRIPARCTYPLGFSSQGFINHWLLLGPFGRRGGPAPGDDVIRLDYLADGAGTTELNVKPRAGDVVRTQYDGAAASASLLRAPARPGLNPDGVPTWTPSTDQDERIAVDWYANSFVRSDMDNFMVYAVTYLEVEDDVAVDLGIASNDSIQVLLDGNEVHINSTERWESDRNAVLDTVPAASHVELSPLTRGHHMLMVKQFEGYGNCAFRFRFQDSEGKPITRGIKVRLVPPDSVFRRGDADANGAVDLTDAIRILNVLFLGIGAISCEDAADADDNGAVNITDAVRVLNVLFLGLGSIPLPGSVDCGIDPVEDGLSACSYASCDP
jgi:hypothetical protein